MAYPIDWLMPEEIRRPKAPAPLNFAIRVEPDSRELTMARHPMERHQLFERMKRQAAAQLANHIAKHCKLFDVSSVDYGRRFLLQMELTVSDRGAYENWLPVAREQGKAAGRAQAVKQMVESLPYGLADAAREFYE